MLPLTGGTLTGPLVIDTHTSAITALEVRAKESNDTIRFDKEDGSALLRARWDGSNFHHYVYGDLYYNLGVSGSAKSIVLNSNGVDGCYLLTQSVDIHLNAPHSGYVPLLVGGESYATAVNAFTNITGLGMYTWAWNGTNGYAVSSFSRISQYQNSATNGDATVKFTGNGAPMLEMDLLSRDVRVPGNFTGGSLSTSLAGFGYIGGVGLGYTSPRSLTISSLGRIEFGSSDLNYPDAGIGRAAAGTLEINNGTPVASGGALRDMRAAKFVGTYVGSGSNYESGDWSGFYREYGAASMFGNWAARSDLQITTDGKLTFGNDFVYTATPDAGIARSTNEYVQGIEVNNGTRIEVGGAYRDIIARTFKSGAGGGHPMFSDSGGYLRLGSQPDLYYGGLALGGSPEVNRVTFSATGVNSFDSGIGRAAAGVVEVTDGNPGVLRDLKARMIEIEGGYRFAAGQIANSSIYIDNSRWSVLGTAVLGFNNGGANYNANDCGFDRKVTGVIQLNDGTPGSHAGTALSTGSQTVAQLLSPVTAGAGARAFVSDADLAASGASVVGGGSTPAPVYSDGTAWKLHVPKSSGTYTFGGTGTPTVADDVTSWLRVNGGRTAALLTLTAKGAPAGGTLAVTIKASTDNGATFATTVGTVSVAAGAHVATQAVSVALADGALLRADIGSVNGAADWSCQLKTA